MAIAKNVVDKTEIKTAIGNHIAKNVVSKMEISKIVRKTREHIHTMNLFPILASGY